jgi:hypothetical protein
MPRRGDLAERPSISWLDAEPVRHTVECDAMAACPDMRWRDEICWPNGRTGAGWEGLAPAWGGERPQPPGIDQLLDGRRLRLRVIYPEGFPMVPPDLYPVEPSVPMERRTLHRWHLNGDGSLCLMQSAEDWRPTNTAVDLVLKASGWFIEYLLVENSDLEHMTDRGVGSSDEIDALLAAKFI